MACKVLSFFLAFSLYKLGVRTIIHVKMDRNYMARSEFAYTDAYLSTTGSIHEQVFTLPFVEIITNAEAMKLNFTKLNCQRV